MIINNSTLTKKAFNLKNVQYLYNNYIYDGDSYVNYGKKLLFQDGIEIRDCIEKCINEDN